MKKGFTLAEVLITLGIIGVVAALTMPSLIAHHKKQVTETRLEKFYSTMMQAQKLSEIDNGEVKTWDDLPLNDSIEWYNKYLAKYLKTTDVKPKEIESEFGINFQFVNIYFPDGSLFFLSKNACYFYPEAKWYKKCDKLKNDLITPFKACSGEHYFTFIYKPSYGIIPYGSMESDEEINTNTYDGCIENPSNERAYCTTVIMRNGWKIPDNYPVKF